MEGHYFRRHEYALGYAQRRAARQGIRFRVQYASWQPSGFPRWWVGPTPAPAPAMRVVEPCS